ncbi:MAG: flavodoxin family protein [Rickettsiales bacterium]|nr:MAG: flavodoxin family protein [Rickettsiales bacterium]
MKVVAINGSIHKNGNTATMLNEVLSVVKENGGETMLLQVGGTNIHGCKACRQCANLKNKKCVFADDCFNDIFTECLDADAIILGTPSYFSNMSPELKSFIDRAGFVALQNGGLFRHKIGAGIVAQRRGGGSLVQATIHTMFLMSEMIIPGSTYWNFGIGMNEGEVVSDAEAMQNMRNLGENIVWLANKVK